MTVYFAGLLPGGEHTEAGAVPQSPLGPHFAQSWLLVGALCAVQALLKTVWPGLQAGVRLRLRSDLWPTPGS